MEEVARLVLERAMKAVNAQAGYLAVRKDNSPKLFIAAYEGIISGLPLEIDLDPEESLSALVLTRRSPILIKDIEQDERLTTLNKPDIGVPRLAYLSVAGNDIPVGTLTMGRKRENPPFSEEDVQFLQTLLHQVAYGLENARLYENLRQSNKELEKALESQKKAQDYLLSSARMAAFGQLSMSIANELNNPLTGILGYAEIALQSEIGDELRGSIEQIRDQAIRAGRINKSLLDFTTTKPGPRISVDLNELVEKSISFVQQNIARKGIELDFRLSDDSLFVSADGARFHEVFLNLINNAVYAMTGEYGTSESGESFTNREKRLIIESGKKNNKCYVSFRDTGAGVSEDNLGKIFEPFFSTRKKTSQVGLGLWASHSIVKAHGGKIHVKSIFGKGSVFTVVLPLKD
jgi:signal transduction histidine kinase